MPYTTAHAGDVESGDHNRVLNALPQEHQDAVNACRLLLVQAQHESPVVCVPYTGAQCNALSFGHETPENRRLLLQVQATHEGPAVTEPESSGSPSVQETLQQVWNLVHSNAATVQGPHFTTPSVVSE